MSGLFMNFFFLNIYLFLGECKQGRGRERGTGDLKQALCWQADSSEPEVGLELMNYEIITWAKVGCSTDWATQVSLFMNFKWVYALNLIKKKNLLSNMKNSTTYFSYNSMHFWNPEGG